VYSLTEIQVRTQTKSVISRNVTKKVEADPRASEELAKAIANQDPEGLKKALSVKHVDGKTILKLIPHKWIKGKNAKKTFTNEYNFKFDWTPFIKYPEIPSQTYRDVYALLKEDLAKQNVFLERNGVGAEVGGAPQGPMHVGDAVTVEALFKVIMSQATSNNNAIAAQTCLAEAFAVRINGKKVEPFYPDFHAIRKASLDDVKAALKPAGLQNMKATNIQLLLQAIHEHNVQSKNPGWDIDTNPPDASTFVPGSLSLEYLNGLSKEQIFDELVALPLIGVKTACCILAFNYRITVFAVDTHVFRISQWLGWIPEVCNRDDACAHLDKFIPDDIKFGLHQGFWHHGQRCKKCAGRMRPGSQSYDDTVCVLEDLITRVVKERKAESKERKAFAKKRKAEIAVAGDVDDAEEPEEVVRNETRRRTKPKKAKPDSSDETDNELAKGKKMQAVIDDGFGAPGSNITGTRTFTWNMEVVKSTIMAVEEIEKKE
jgi:endonuclease III